MKVRIFVIWIYTSQVLLQYASDYKPSLSNPAGLVQQCGLDTPQEVINYGTPKGQANNNRFLTDKNAHGILV